MRIATFNVQNMRLRGDRLDGARDRDAAREDAALDAADRVLTARIIAEMDADVVALQEVFDATTLDHFHDRWLLGEGAAPYPYRVCLPGNDGHGLNVALLSRVPLQGVASHADLRPGDLGLAVPERFGVQPVFRRDCLAAKAGGITLFVCHFKAPWPDRAASALVRRLEAEAVRRIVEARFPDPAAALWLILGDLNDPEAGDGMRPTAPIRAPFSVDLSQRMPEEERWSYLAPGGDRYTMPDALLASPALAERYPDAVPQVVRAGLGREAVRYTGPRLSGVGEHRPHASDHGALMVDLGP